MERKEIHYQHFLECKKRHGHAEDRYNEKYRARSNEREREERKKKKKKKKKRRLYQDQVWDPVQDQAFFLGALQLVDARSEWIRNRENIDAMDMFHKVHPHG